MYLSTECKMLSAEVTLDSLELVSIELSPLFLDLSILILC